MTNHEPDPISEVHASLDQLSRVAISAVLQMAELKARRGAERARRRRDEQVALAKAMGAQLEDDQRRRAYPTRGGDPAFVPAVSGGGAAWAAVGGAHWWATATGEDLGRMWEAATRASRRGRPRCRRSTRGTEATGVRALGLGRRPGRGRCRPWRQTTEPENERQLFEWPRRPTGSGGSHGRGHRQRVATPGRRRRRCSRARSRLCWPAPTR